MAPRRQRDDLRSRARARRAVRRLRARRRASIPRGTPTAGSTPATSAAPTDADYLVFLERGAESIRVKGEFVPIPFVENHLAAVDGIADHAMWKRKGALVDEEVVLYAVADDAAGRAAADPDRRAAVVHAPGRGRPGRRAAPRRGRREGPAPPAHRPPRPRLGGAGVSTPGRLGGRHGRPAHARRAQPAAPPRRRPRDRRGRARRRASATVVLKAHEGSTVERAAAAGEGVYGGDRAEQPGRRRQPGRGRGRRAPGRPRGVDAHRVGAHAQGAAPRHRSCPCTAASSCAPVDVMRRRRPAAAVVRRARRRRRARPGAGQRAPVRRRDRRAVPRGRRRGVQRLMVNHPMMAFLRWNDEASPRCRNSTPTSSSASCPTCSATPTTPASASPAATRPRCSSSAATSATPTTRPGRRGRAVAARLEKHVGTEHAPPRS